MLPVMLGLSFCSLGFVLSFEFFKMCEQLCFAREAAEVVAQHFKSSFGRLATGPQIDQQARNDCAVALDLDAVRSMAEQM